MTHNSKTRAACPIVNLIDPNKEIDKKKKTTPNHAFHTITNALHVTRNGTEHNPP